MVMGVQRSGTTALFHSLATDESVTAMAEDIDSAFFCNFLLRPVREIGPLIERSGGRMLLKPISETCVRSLTDVAEEFRLYPLRFVWIYRDPVNVLHSMYREKWMAAEEIDRPDLHRGWRRRNQLALDFQRQCPDAIAIVRYEDLCLDPAVFRQLAAWLGLHCRSLFRKDTAVGRKFVSAAVQENIDAATSDVLNALQAGRTFCPRRRFRVKQRLASRFALSKSGDASASRADERFPTSQPARSPSSIDGLHFWLHPGCIPRAHGPITSDVIESGRGHRASVPAENGPYALRNLHQRGTLFYPHSKVEERRRGASGTLLFEGDWNFVFDESGFSIFAVFRPNVPCYPPFNQERCVLLRIGPRDRAAPRFSLCWDGVSSSAEARIDFAGLDNGDKLISTGERSLPRQHWAVVVAECSTGRPGEFRISANGIRGESGSVSRNHAPHQRESCVLELGGVAAEKETLFYGQLAELVIFARALGEEETSGVTQYLRETHRL